MAKFILMLEERSLTTIFREARETGYTPKLFKELLNLGRSPSESWLEPIARIRLAILHWKNFNYKEASKLIEEIFPKQYHTIIDHSFPKGIEDTQKEIQSIKEFAKKLKNKPLKLKEDKYV